MSSIAVFGSSEPGPGEPLYRAAESLGRRLARSGFAVVTGGYGGVMEAASKGAREAGGRAIGVVCRIFPDREPNPWLTRVVDSVDLHERTRELIERAAGFVVLEGRAGTLAELAFLWALARAGQLGDRPVVLLGDPWEPLVALAAERGYLLDPELAVVRRAADPAAAVECLRRALGVP